jgi:ribonuclease HII
LLSAKPPDIPDFSEELVFWRGGRRVAGLDEAGRGPWAGPVTAGAVAFPAGEPAARWAGLTDSKILTEKGRELWYARIADYAAVATGWATPAEIDALNILRATKLAMLRAVFALHHQAGCDALLIDAVKLSADDFQRIPEWAGQLFPPLLHGQKSFIRGEQRSLSIAAASVVAKVSRDRHMAELDLRHPGYGFAGHKGYGTKSHQTALQTLGPCAAHRRSFKPVAAFIQAA